MIELNDIDDLTKMEPPITSGCSTTKIREEEEEGEGQKHEFFLV